MYGARGEEGVIDMAVNQLFYAMEETPDRKFLVTVRFQLIFLSKTIFPPFIDTFTRCVSSS